MRSFACKLDCLSIPCSTWDAALVQDYTGFVPANGPYTLTDPTKWQPLVIEPVAPYGGGSIGASTGAPYVQHHITPQVCRTPTFVTSGAYHGISPGRAFFSRQPHRYHEPVCSHHSCLFGSTGEACQAAPDSCQACDPVLAPPTRLLCCHRLGAPRGSATRANCRRSLRRPPATTRHRRPTRRRSTKCSPTPPG